MDKYPFKFLDAYGKNDTKWFFGRDEEINTMYQMIFQGNILLVYGASGTGKTSLIQCGLASKFQAHDWLALNIRRGNNLIASFEKALADAGGNIDSDDDAIDFSDIIPDGTETKTTQQLSPLAKSFKAIYLNYFRPIYLIFDQFEELFILGNSEEQRKFIEIVKEIQKLEQPVKMIFSIREEYLGNLLEFEKEVPQLLRKKLRVEPMNLDKVRQVLTGVTTLKDSNIRLKNGEEQLISESIFSKIKGKDKSLTIQLPYLQVFLDKLYLETTNDDTRQANAVFSFETIRQMGDIGDVLRDFLENQVKAISANQSTPGKPVSTETIWKILSPFATLEGTKEPILINKLTERLPDVDTTLIRNTVNAFVNSRILRHSESNDTYELAHDALAPKIASKRTDEEIALLEVHKLISSQVSLNKEARELFTEKQLNFINPFLTKLKIEPEERLLINESRKELDRKKIRQTKQRRIIYISLTCGLLLFSGISIYAIYQARKAQSLVLLGKAYINLYAGNVTKGFRYAQESYKEEPQNVDGQRAMYHLIFQNGSPKRCFYRLSLETGKSLSSIGLSNGGDTIFTRDSFSVAIWNARTGRKLDSFEFHKNITLSSVSSDDTKFLTLFDTGVVMVSEIATHESINLYHKDPIKFAAFSNYGNYVLTRSLKTVRIWDDNAGIMAEYSGTKNAMAAAFSPNDRNVLIASNDDTARIWNIKKNTIIKLPHPGKLKVANYSKTGNFIMTKADDSTAKLWDTTGKEIKFAAMGKVTGPPVFSNNDSLLATVVGNVVSIWSLSSRKLLDTVCHRLKISAIIFSPDDKKLVTTSYDQTAKILDLNISKGHKEHILKGHKGIIGSAIFSPNGTKLLTISYDKTGKLWSMSGREMATLVGHKGNVRAAAFTPDGTKILTRSFDNTVKLWDINLNRRLKTKLNDSIKIITSLPVKRQFYPIIKFCPADTSLLANKQLPQANDIPTFISFASNGKKIATIVRGKVFIWDAQDYVYGLFKKGKTASTFINSNTPDKLFLLSRNDTIKLDYNKHKMPQVLDGHKKTIYTAIFSPDGNKVATASEDNTAIIWDLVANTKKVLTGHKNRVLLATFSPDGKKVITVSEDNTAIIWDCTIKDSVQLIGHVGLVRSASFSSDGATVVTASQDNTAKLWDVISGKQLGELNGHTNFVNTAFFSHNGQLLVTTSEDKTTRLWDVATLSELAILQSYRYGEATGAFFSSDNSKVLSLHDKGIIIWPVSIPDIIKIVDPQIAELPQEEKKHIKGKFGF